MSTISSSTTSTTAYKVTADTTGTLVFQTGATPTTAMTLGTDQSVTFAGTPTYSGGTANGVAYLNGSKVLTTGSALVFDGTNLGVGVTPVATWSGYKVLQAGIASFAGGSSGAYLLQDNAYTDNSGASWKYINSSYAAAQYYAASGAHVWRTAASGTAGNTISFTQAMTLTASGYLGIGTTNPLAGFANYQTTSQLSSGNASSNGLWNVTNRTNASNNATTDVLRFLTATGASLNGYVSGHVYITATGASGGNGYSAIYTLVTTSNGSSPTTFTLVTSVTRGTNPVASVAITDDGAGGAVKVQVTWINNSGVVTGGGCTASFVGLAS